MKHGDITLWHDGVLIGTCNCVVIDQGILFGKLEPAAGWSILDHSFSRAALKREPQPKLQLEVRDAREDALETRRVDLFRRPGEVIDVEVTIWLLDDTSAVGSKIAATS